MKDNIHIDGYVFKGYLVRLESTIQQGIIIATPEMADDPQEYANEALQSVGTIVHGSDNIGKQIAFRYDVLEDGGIENGIRKYTNRILLDGEILWEVNKSNTSAGQVIGIKEKDGWRCWGRHVVLKQVVRPEYPTSFGIIIPEAVEKDKFEIAWPNKFLPVGLKVGVVPNSTATLQVEGQLLYYVPEEYIFFKYND